MKIQRPVLVVALGFVLSGSGTASADADLFLTPLTPIIGVNPGGPLDFGRVCLGECGSRVIELYNGNPNPESILEIIDLQTDPTPEFEIFNMPPVPFQIAGGDPPITLVIRFCPQVSGPAAGTLEIAAAESVPPNPRIVDLLGIGNRPPTCDAHGPYSGFTGQPIQFTGTASDPDGDPIAYEWDFGDGHTAGGASPTHVYSDCRRFDVVLSVTDGCVMMTCPTTADVRCTPICDAGGPYSALLGHPIQFDGTNSTDPDGVIVSYEWDFGDGSTGTGATPTHTYNDVGNYTAELCVTDNDNATACCSTQVEIFALSAVGLASFTARSEDGVVTLEWRTSSEESNLGFYIERAQAGTTSFARINQTRIAGNRDRGGDYSYVDRTGTPGETYVYRLVAIDQSGFDQRLGHLEVTVARAVPNEISLSQNQPNPFNPSTTISFALPEAARVTLRVYDARGSLIRTLIDRELGAAEHAVEWNGRDDRGNPVAAGVYLYRLQAGAKVLQHKMILAK